MKNRGIVDKAGAAILSTYFSQFNLRTYCDGYVCPGFFAPANWFRAGRRREQEQGVNRFTHRTLSCVAHRLGRSPIRVAELLVAVADVGIY